MAPRWSAFQPRRPPSSAGRRAGRSSAGSGRSPPRWCLSVVTTTFIVGSRVDRQLAAQDATIAALETLTTATLDVSAEPDAEHVALTGVTDPNARRQPRLLAVDRPSSSSCRTGLDPAAGRSGVPLLGRGRRQAPAGREDVLQRRPGLLGRRRSRPCRGCRGRRRSVSRWSACPASRSTTDPVLVGRL